MAENLPVCIILVSSGTKGDRLLFRYPFLDESNSKQSVYANTKNPYICKTQDGWHADSERRKAASYSVENGVLVGYSDKILANLLAVKQGLCGMEFSLKIDDVHFVGFPLGTPKRELTSMISFNIAFALRASVPSSVIACYHNLAKQIAVALQHEERRCGYLSAQKNVMWGIQDEVASLPEHMDRQPFLRILEASPLAKNIKKVYSGLMKRGTVLVRINKWIEVNFCLPHQAYKLLHNDNIIQPEKVQRCLEKLRPYHAMLLLVNKTQLQESLPLDASPSLVRLIRMACPTKSLQQLASDADLALSHVFQLVSHLVYWAKATIIYPLCESNVYVISPDANTSVNSELGEKFTGQFPGMSLLDFLSDFSYPIPYSERKDFLSLPQQQSQHIQMLVWLLQYHLIVQLHTYIYLMPPPSGNHRNRSVSQTLSSDDSEMTRASSLSDVGSLTSDESPGSSIQRSLSEDACTTRPDEARTHSRQQSTSPILTPNQQQSIKNVPAASNPEDLKMFMRLCRYFDGTRHLEDIMYYENVKRSQLLTLIDKFRSVLITCVHQDPATSFHLT